MTALAQGRPSRAQIAIAVPLMGCAGCAIWAASVPGGHLTDSLTIWLIVCAAISNVAAAQWRSRLVVSGSFMAAMLAIGFLDPQAVFVIVVAADLLAWPVERYELRSLPINIVSAALPDLLVATAFEALDLPHGALFYIALGIAAVVALLINGVLIAFLTALRDNDAMWPRLQILQDMRSAFAINVAMTVAIAAVYVSIGIAGVLLMLFAVLAFTYMARLVVVAQERTREYAALSWGVLSGLLRTLEQRDPRSARHAAAVAMFARDVAEQAGLGPRECELAHTSGLLHDIGGFGLSDRVLERGRTLTEQDWQSIRKHPVLGADLLRDLGSYGPVAEIVRAHHERIDGRGYPDGLTGDEIPEIAKIVAVAEVYDTLTAHDTYRTPMSSFEALNELRRVSGTQLEGRYVEALATLLSGRSTDYRHAHEADFDRELDLERRIIDAANLETAGTESGDPAGPALG